MFLLFQLNGLTQQAWPQKKGEGLIMAGSSLFFYRSVHGGYQNEGRVIPRPIMEIIASLYAEYGLSNGLTFFFKAPYHFTSNGELEDNWTGTITRQGSLNKFGNMVAGSTLKIYQSKGFILSTQLKINLNTSSYQPETGLRTGYNTTVITPIILTGYGSEKFFASVEAGCGIYGNNYAERMLMNAQFGKRFTKSKHLLFVLALSSTTLIGSISKETSQKLDENSFYTALYMNEQEFLAGAIKVGYEFFRNWSAWLAISGGAAKNIGENLVYNLAVGYAIKK